MDIAHLESSVSWRRMLTRALSALVFAALAGVAPLAAHAHGMRTGVLELVETEPGTALATWRTTAWAPEASPRFAPECTREETSGATRGTQSFVVRCPNGLAGTRIEIEGLGAVLNEAVIRVRLLDAPTVSRVVVPENAGWRVPGAPASPPRVATEYTGRGITHIAGGLDHLLFLLILVLWLRRVRTVLIAESAFTISHTASYAATALGWIHFRSTVAEACIALSLVLGAAAVWQQHAKRKQTPVPAWEGACLAFVFGAVHGLGFAGGLAELGLPDQAAASALAGFALGIEAAQVAFLALVLGAVTVMGRMRILVPARIVATVLVGAVGSYWLIDRVLAL